MSTSTHVTHATGTLAERGDGRIVLALGHSDYRLHLVADTDAVGIADAQVGRPISGHIHAQARRVDVVTTGGRFIDPVYGSPRRLQGRVVAVDRRVNAITVDCCTFVTCALMDSQVANDFEPGMLVSFDVQSGARFELLD